MKVLLRKFGKLKFIYKFIYILVTILFISCTVYFTNSLLLLKGIENGIRAGIIVLFIIFVFIYILVSLLMLFTKRNKTFVFSSLFVFIVIIIITFLGYFITKTFNVIDQMSENSITYSTSLVTMKDGYVDDNSIIGIIDNEDDIEGYVLANKLLKQEKLENVELKQYTNYLDMLMDLYDGVTNGILIGSNYASNYSSYEIFANIKEESKEIAYYSEVFKSEEKTKQKRLTEPFTVFLLGVDSEYD